MATIEQARKKATELHATGERLLQAFPIEQQLGKLGRVEVESSYTYELMVKPDIDFHVWVDEYEFVSVADLARYYMTQDHIIRVMTNNFIDYQPSHPSFPQGVYLGIKIDFEDKLWNLDIWFVRHDRKHANEFAKLPKNWYRDITTEQSDAILLLKNVLWETSRYGKDFLSTEIYLAVVLDDVRSLSDLEKWRETHPPASFSDKNKML